MHLRLWIIHNDITNKDFLMLIICQKIFHILYKPNIEIFINIIFMLDIKTIEKLHNLLEAAQVVQEHYALNLKVFHA